MRRSTLVPLLCLALATSAACAGSERSRSPAIVEMIRRAHGVQYSVNSRSTGSTATTDILYMLNQIHKQRGANAPVIVLVDPSVSIDDIWNLQGIADKAQLNNVHFFVRTRDPRKMAEIKWGPLLPYSTTPHLQ